MNRQKSLTTAGGLDSFWRIGDGTCGFDVATATFGWGERDRVTSGGRMGMYRGTATALYTFGAGRRSLARAFLACLALALAAGLLGAGAAQAQTASKVLVFHGPADETTTPGVDAIEAIGDENDFTVDATADAAQLTAANLANYRAV